MATNFRWCFRSLAFCAAYCTWGVVCAQQIGAGSASSAAYEHEVSRMSRLDVAGFCSKELRKLKGRKSPLPQPWFDALAARGKELGVGGNHLVSIQEGGVEIGMNQCGALAAWGKPQHVNRTTTAYGTREQWVFGGRNYLYFRDDRLESIQN